VSGSLIKIAETTVTSAVSSVTLTGIDSTYNVYMCKMNNVVADSDGRQLLFRVTASGTAQTTSNYDQALKGLRTDTSFTNQANQNQSAWLSGTFLSGNGTGEEDDGIFYLFNFNNASEYSFATFETVKLQGSPFLAGEQGGGVYTVTEAHNGVNFSWDGGHNFSSGKFTLYGLKK
jgi:hypothetical protein